MSAASCLFSEEQFLCSICLDVFTDPVSIPCGHNFCKQCITHHWDVNESSQCPLCAKLYERRPELHVNTFIAEMVAQFRQSTVKKTSRVFIQRSSSSVPVLCDVCTDTKVKALKSCLMCLTSYCETHLEPHHRIPGLKRHELIDPVENLEERMCRSHGRPLEMFCKTDQMCVCRFCTESSHKQHAFVQMIDEYKLKKDKLMKLDAEIQKNIHERQLKIEQMRQAVMLSRDDADRETAASMDVFTALIQSVEKGLAVLLDVIEKKHKKIEEEAEDFIKKLEDEISVLKKRSNEVQQLSCTEDHLQFLQNFSFLNITVPVNKWSHVCVHSSYKGTIARALAQLEKTLSEMMPEMCANVDLKRVQHYVVDVTLDPETASSYLLLSDDLKQVKSALAPQDLPDNPLRFSYCNGVLGKQSFSAGRFYYEVQVGEKTDWDLGLAAESVNRKGKICLSPKNGFWTVWLRKGKEYKALAGPGVPLYPKVKPQKVGVFVDYEEGLVSFYDVDAAVLIHSFTYCNFTEKLFPYFSPCTVSGGSNTAPLIILPPTTRRNV